MYLHTYKRRGFSLIELMVAVSIFTVVMTVSVGTLLSLADANRKAQTLASVTNNLNFALDSMTRAIRTGYTYHCTDTPNSLPSGVSDCVNGASGFVFTDSSGQRVGYRLSDSRIERNIDSGGWVPLTASEIEITDMRFYMNGSTPADTVQPMVTISIQGETDIVAKAESSFDIQTSVTQRFLDE